MLDRPTLDRTQENFGIRSTSYDDGWRCVVGPDVNKGPLVTKIPIGKARSCEQKYLQQPVKYDRLLSKKERAIKIGGDDDIVEDQDDESQKRGRLDDIEGVHKGNEPPFCCRQVKDIKDNAADGQEIGQRFQEQRQAQGKIMIIKTEVTAHEHRCHDRYQVMQRDQNISGSKLSTADS